MSLRARVALTRGSFSLEAELEVEAGRTVVLLGPNGSGKSTLVEALAGLLRIERGEVSLDGGLLERPRDGIRLPAQRRPIGVMFQGLWLFPHLSVHDNVAYGIWARGTRRARARTRVEPLLERMQLRELARRRPAQLSGGEAQRVALARALAVEPRLLLLDEPLSALDLQSRPRTRGFLQQVLREFEGPRLVITHDPLEALLLADRLVVLEEGRVAQAGTSEEVRSHPRTRYVATLSGVNLISGTLHAEPGETLLACADLTLAVRPTDLPAGTRVHATIHPSAVRLARREPSEARPNTWRTRVASLYLEGDRVRMQLEAPEGFSAEVAAEGIQPQSFAPGTAVWVTVSPKDVSLYPI